MSMRASGEGMGKVKVQKLKGKRYWGREEVSRERV
jgi:hypothetical protein